MFHLPHDPARTEFWKKIQLLLPDEVTPGGVAMGVHLRDPETGIRIAGFKSKADAVFYATVYGLSEFNVVDPGPEEKSDPAPLQTWFCAMVRAGQGLSWRNFTPLTAASPGQGGEHD